jgi:thiol-disulfide isomerase/thioredoxin
MNVTKALLSLIFILGMFAAHGQKQMLVRIHNTNINEAILYAIKGANSIPIDTAHKQMGHFVFNDIDKLEAGVYNVYLSDSIYLETIINNEDISLEADARDLLSTVVVHKSLENQILFGYWKYAFKVRERMVSLQLKRNIALRSSNNQMTEEIKMIDQEIVKMNQSMEVFAFQQAYSYPKAFAPVLLKAYQIPSYKTYVEQGNEPYPNEEMFYLYHFFDNIDFTDERLLNTKVIYVAINDYIKTFGKQATSEIYKDISDKVLVHTKVNPKVHRYAIELFIESFEASIFQSVFYHVVENHLLNSGEAFHEFEKETYRKKVEISKSLQIGKVLKDLKAKDMNGEKVSLHGMKADIKLLVFWNSGCEHCHELLPVIKSVSETYAEVGLKVMAFGIEDQRNSWVADIQKFELEKITHVTDFKGLLSPVIEDYNVWMTPLMYLLDKDNVIVAKPRNEAELYQALIEIQHSNKN